jgi:sphingomyelin phosphodiesterase
VTTYSNLNPGYRIFTIDGDYSGTSYWALDHRTVIMNLTESNMYNKTIFQDEYNARDAYQMKNLFPNDWSEFLDRLQNDIDGPLMKLVYKHYRKSNGSSCDHNCLRALLCILKSARSGDPHVCDSIPPF